MTLPLTNPRPTPDLDPPTPSRVGRLTRLVSSAPRRSLLAVFLFVLVAGFFGGPVAGSLESAGGFAPENADSVRAVERIETATGRAPSAGIVLLVETPDGLPGDDDRVAEVTQALASQSGVVDVSSPTSTRGDPAGLVSTDGTQVLVLGTLAADADDDAVAESVLDTFDGQSDVTVGGSALVGVQLGATVSEDLGRAEMMAFPILALLSLLFFRGRAALMPLVVGITTVLGTFLVITGINQLYGMSVFALNLVIGLGLGLAIDYTLFLVTRYREELAAQGPTLGAITTTMRTAGRTVAFSAATVAVALAALTTFPLGFIKSMGIAGAVVAVVAATSALVISPAMFGLWGAKLGRKRAERPEDTGRWYRFSHAVMRRPGAIAVVTGLIMLILAAPALRAEWTPIDSSVIPTDKSSRTVADAVESDFGGTGASPMTVAISTDRDDDEAAVAAYADQVNALPGVASAGVPVQLDETTWQLDVSAQGGPEGSAAQQLVDDTRAVSGDGVDGLVAGPAAEFVDQQTAIGSRLPVAVGLIVALTLLVLWLMTGSVVLPVKAVVMNVLTVAASLGVLTYVYQDGRLTGLLGYTPNGGIEPTDFLVTATLIFALSTDYGVFLLGRIKELRDSGLGERESVAVGVQRTGAVITAAAILLAVAIGAFSTSSISFIQQIGVATAFGVLVDAFLVRSLLVPALMGLLGKYNWWAPMPLRRLHDRIGLSER
jgi:RND superfamily putative drug exporter